MDIVNMPARPAAMRSLLLKRSESLPSTGMTTSCSPEEMVSITPMETLDMPTSSAA